MPTEDVGDELNINSEEVQMLKQIIKPAAGGQPSTVPKSGNKWGSTHFDGGSGSSDSSGEDLDARKCPNQEEDINAYQGITPKSVVQR